MALTQQELKNFLNYDPETGDFVWRIGKASGKKAGSENYGYLVIKIINKYYRAHRLAWLYVHGRMPSVYIDHINGIKNDNRIVNLRECSGSENYWNVGANIANTSGFKGVSWHKRSGKWQALIRINNKRKYLGIFETAEIASTAYNKKAKELHGEFYHDIN